MLARSALLLIGIGLIAAAIGAGYLLGQRHAPDSSSGEPALAAVAAETTATIWTCSMHPQVQLPKPGKCPICFMDLIPMEQSDGEEGLRELKMSPTAMALANIQTTPVVRQVATREINMVGKVEYDETRLAYITSWIPGRLDRLYVDYTGVQVKKGDHLVYLYSPQLIVAQRELIQAWGQYNRVSDARNREMVAANLKSVEEKLRLWGLLSEQIEAIKQRGETTDHTTIYAPVSGTVVHKNALEGAYVKEGERIYTIADLSLVWVYLDAYESDLPWLRYGQEVEFTTESYSGEIFKGRIAFIDPVLNEKTRTVRLRVNVPNAGDRLKPGMFVRATVRSRLAAGGEVVDAALAGKWVSPMHPEIVKDGPGKCDVCGMDLVPAEELGFVASQEVRQPPLVIPATAPLLTGKRAVVYVKRPDRDEPTFEGREILLGQRAGDYYIVRAGLDEGEQVVTEGNFKIDSALQIKAKPSMMNPEGGVAAVGHQHGGQAAAPAGGGEHAGHGAGLAASGQHDVPSDFRASLTPSYQAYLAAVNALAGDDLAAARDAVARLREAADAVTADALAEHAQAPFHEIRREIVFSSYELLDSKDVAAARQHFRELSQAMISLAEGFGHVLPDPLHRVQCPMAFKGQGAGWLQTSDVVRNPYYGARMLKCGEHVTTYASQAPLQVPSQFRQQLSGVYTAYLELQTALANDRAADAKAAWDALRIAMAAVDAAALDDRALLAWKQLRQQLDSALEAPVAGADLAQLRQGFEPVSMALLALVDQFGHAQDITLQQAYCSMAFDNRGAKWLQAGEKLANPYFGNKMLRCGEIQKEFAAAGQTHTAQHGR